MTRRVAPACSTGWSRPAPTFLFGVPTHAIDLLTELRARGAERLGLVTGFRISGAAAPAQVIGELMRYGVVPQSGYGMTETCSHQYTLPTTIPPSHRRDLRAVPAPAMRSASGARTIRTSRPRRARSARSAGAAPA